MALLNLDKIMLHRTVVGITCPSCAGLLEAIIEKSGWLRKLSGKKERVKMRYRCQDCRKRFEMSEKDSPAAPATASRIREPSSRRPRRPAASKRLPATRAAQLLQCWRRAMPWCDAYARRHPLSPMYL